MGKDDIAKILVMVIEDDPDTTALLKKRLSSLKVVENILAFPNGSEALKHLETASALPQLIILDLQLPDGSGHEILSMIKENPLWKSIPVIINSASENKDDILATYRNGGLFFMKKSNDKEILFNTILEMNMKGMFK